MLTRLNSQRVDYLQQATELVAFAIEFEANMFKQEIGRGQGGRGTADEAVDFTVAAVEIKVDEDPLPVLTARRLAPATIVVKSGT
ncbi:hypothetical protein PF010_g32172 [Phytophthora fragariae]|uniref:Uncharacterized protein n=1 Tax=Phytophthora fragariae TaxID=53985 RepID=A0A6G0JFP7_9STRA|nr:hypothetical protein PF010_g32172 [Phytophthora fragariae]